MISNINTILDFIEKYNNPDRKNVILQTEFEKFFNKYTDDIRKFAIYPDDIVNEYMRRHPEIKDSGEARVLLTKFFDRLYGKGEWQQYIIRVTGESIRNVDVLVQKFDNRPNPSYKGQ